MPKSTSEFRFPWFLLSAHRAPSVGEGENKTAKFHLQVQVPHSLILWRTSLGLIVFFPFLSFSLTFPLLFGQMHLHLLTPSSQYIVFTFFSALLTPRTIRGGGVGGVWIFLTLLQWLEHISPFRFPRHTRTPVSNPS